MWIKCTMKKLLTLTVFLTVVCLFGQTSPGEYTINGVGINTKLSDFGTAFFGKDKESCHIMTVILDLLL